MIIVKQANEIQIGARIGDGGKQRVLIICRTIKHEPDSGGWGQPQSTRHCRGHSK